MKNAAPIPSRVWITTGGTCRIRILTASAARLHRSCMGVRAYLSLAACYVDRLPRPRLH